MHCVAFCLKTSAWCSQNQDDFYKINNLEASGPEMVGCLWISWSQVMVASHCLSTRRKIFQASANFLRLSFWWWWGIYYIWLLVVDLLYLIYLMMDIMATPHLTTRWWSIHAQHSIIACHLIHYIWVSMTNTSHSISHTWWLWRHSVWFLVADMLYLVPEDEHYVCMYVELVTPHMWTSHS